MGILLTVKGGRGGGFMAYTTKMESWKKVELQNAGVTIHVHENGSKIGRLEISKGE
jgi:hypothetical protein